MEGNTDDQACRLRAAMQGAGIDVMKIKRQTPSGRSYLVWVDGPAAAEHVAASVRDIGTARVVDEAECRRRSAADVSVKRAREAQAASATVDVPAASAAALL